jgi:peptide/nickel transport system substrate-binding protein
MARPAIVRAASATTLKFIPYADLALLDPLATALVTRNHILMVYETLWGLDESFVPRYQMLAGHTVEDGGKLWTLTLRDNLFFHDRTPVRGRDVVASLRRWATRDAFGDALMQATDELAAPAAAQCARQAHQRHPCDHAGASRHPTDGKVAERGLR